MVDIARILTNEDSRAEQLATSYCYGLRSLRGSGRRGGENLSLSVSEPRELSRV